MKEGEGTMVTREQVYAYIDQVTNGTLPAFIIFKSPCTFCKKALATLGKKKASESSFRFEKVDKATIDTSVLAGLQTTYGHRTMPMIWYDKKFIGGNDKLQAAVKAETSSAKPRDRRIGMGEEKGTEGTEETLPEASRPFIPTLQNPPPLNTYKQYGNGIYVGVFNKRLANDIVSGHKSSSNPDFWAQRIHYDREGNRCNTGTLGLDYPGYPGRRALNVQRRNGHLAICDPESGQYISACDIPEDVLCELGVTPDSGISLFISNTPLGGDVTPDSDTSRLVRNSSFVCGVTSISDPPMSIPNTTFGCGAPNPSV